MARSTYVYLLTQYGQLYGAFTVKHELVSWVLYYIPPHLYSEYRVHRMPDGEMFSPGLGNQFNLREFME